jgi:hypothetical protein
MSDPTLLTTVTADTCARSAEPLASQLVGKVPQFMWLIILLLGVAIVFLYLWRRGDRLALVNLRRAQSECIRAEDCAAMVAESIEEYDRQRNRLVTDAQITTRMADPLDQDNDQDDQDDQDNDELSEEEEDDEENGEEDDEENGEEDDEEEDDDEDDDDMSDDNDDEYLTAMSASSVATPPLPPATPPLPPGVSPKPF